MNSTFKVLTHTKPWGLHAGRSSKLSKRSRYYRGPRVLYCITNVKQNRLEVLHFKPIDHHWDREELTAGNQENGMGGPDMRAQSMKLFQSQTERVRFRDLERKIRTVHALWFITATL